jgi:predicted phage terminase large subunit-like protein
LLMLPTEFESSRRCVTSLGFQDPRQVEGELLWPSRFTPKVIADTKILLGSYGFAGQHQQRPSPKGGGTIKLEWFKRFHVEPARFLRCTISVDTANKGTVGSAYTTAGVFLETEQGDYLVDVWRERVEFPELVRKTIALHDKYLPTAIVIEDKASGIQLLQTLRTGINDRRYPAIGIEPQGDKETRLSVESPYIEAGNVYLPEAAPWLWDFEQEAESFPNSAFMDQMDMLSQFLTYRRIRGADQIRTAKVVGY